MKIKKISVFDFVILIVLLVAACTNVGKSDKDIAFSELSKDIQDTLLCISQKVLEEDYSPQTMIDFSGNCKFVEKNIGPWTVGIQIEDTVDNISISLPSNAPAPYIVYDNYIYYPYEYNVLVMGLNNTKFKAVKLK